MKTLKKIQREIKLRRKTQTDYAIAKVLNVDQAEISRLTKGKYPGEKVAARLGLPIVCHTCKRTMPKPKQPRQPAPKIGQDGWMEYWMRKIK